MRAVALIDPGAVERNCRRLRDELSPGAELCAVVKADGYGHGAVTCAAPRWPAARPARGRHRRRGGRACVRSCPRRRLLVLGALDRRRARAGARAPTPTSRCGGRAFSSWSANRAGARGDRPAGARQVRHRHGPARASATRDVVIALVETRRRRPPSVDLVGALDPFRDRRRARLGVLRRAARALSRARAAAARALRRTPPARGQQRRDAARAGVPTSTWSAAGSRSTGSTRSARTPPSRGSSRRSSCAPTSPT